jgi:hypothetical protein
MHVGAFSHSYHHHRLINYSSTTHPVPLRMQGLAKQVQAINSKLGLIQAQMQKNPKSYTAVASAAVVIPPPASGVQAPAPKPPRELQSHARLVLVPQVPLDATFDPGTYCALANRLLANPM